MLFSIIFMHLYMDVSNFCLSDIQYSFRVESFLFPLFFSFGFQVFVRCNFLMFMKRGYMEHSSQKKRKEKEQIKQL